MKLLNAAKEIITVLESGWFPLSLARLPKLHIAIENLRAGIEEAEKQEPVLWMDNRTDVVSPAFRHTRKGYNTPLYLHPASSIPEGWKLVPIEPTPKMQNVMDKGSAYNTWRNMLDAAPQSPKEKS